MIEYVCGFIVSGSWVVLIEKQRPEWQRGRLNGVGGKVEVGEIVLAAMAREAHEETGIQTRPDDWKLCAVVHTGHSVVNFCLCRLSNLCKLVSSSEGRVDWELIRGLPANTIHNIPWLLSLCLDDELLTPVKIIYHEETDV